jgi:hypothetical protein
MVSRRHHLSPGDLTVFPADPSKIHVPVFFDQLQPDQEQHVRVRLQMFQ